MQPSRNSPSHALGVLSQERLLEVRLGKYILDKGWWVLYQQPEHLTGTLKQGLHGIALYKCL